MIWSASSVWRGRRVNFCVLGPLRWGASIMTRLSPPGWSSGMPAGSARDCLRRNWQFRQSFSGTVHWPRLLSLHDALTTASLHGALATPSFTTRSCSRCASFLKTSWSASWVESSLSWKPVLCAAQCGTEVEHTGTFCVSVLTRHYACRDLDDETEGIPRWRVFFLSDPGAPN